MDNLLTINILVGYRVTEEKSSPSVNMLLINLLSDKERILHGGAKI